MLSTDKSHIKKYMTTLGVAMVAGTLTLAGLFLRSEDALLLPRDEIDALTPLAREAVERRQIYLDVATAMLPWFVAVGIILGMTLAAVGLFGWMARQRVTDSLEDIAVEKGRFELRVLSDAERINKAEQEALDDIGAQAAPETEKAPQGEAREYESSVSEPETNLRRRARTAMNASMEAELSLAVKLEEALGDAYKVDIGVEFSSGPRRRVFDVIARPKDPRGSWYVFEVKRVTAGFERNYKNRTTEAISQVAFGSTLLPRVNVRPVALMVVPDDLAPSSITEAQSYGDAFAASFAVSPTFLILRVSELEHMAPETLARCIGASPS